MHRLRSTQACVCGKGGFLLHTFRRMCVCMRVSEGLVFSVHTHECIDILYHVANHTVHAAEAISCFTSKKKIEAAATAAGTA